MSRFLLLLLSKVFQGAVKIRRLLYDWRIIRDYTLGVQVIAIGNLTVGGTGKTPVVEKFARELKNLHDEGWSFEDIAKIACRTTEYIRQFIRLIENGEDRLIQGVEQEVFPISFAVLVAKSDDARIQNVLMDAFDQGIVNSNNFAKARSIITARTERRKRKGGDMAAGGGVGANHYTVTIPLPDDTATQVAFGTARVASAGQVKEVTLNPMSAANPRPPAVPASLTNVVVQHTSTELALSGTLQPRRVIVDRHAQTPPGARILAAGDALVVTAGDRNTAWPTGTEVVAPTTILPLDCSATAMPTS